MISPFVKAYVYIDADGNETMVGMWDKDANRFDPNFAIAESWRRLAFDPKNIKPHDLTLLNHEIMEMELVIKGIPQDVAHYITSEKYNYSEESREFYRNLRIEKHKGTYYDKLKEVAQLDTNINIFERK